MVDSACSRFWASGTSTTGTYRFVAALRVAALGRRGWALARFSRSLGLGINFSPKKIPPDVPLYKAGIVLKPLIHRTSEGGNSLD